MGFIQAVKGSIGGTLADQWKDFYGPMTGISDTAAISPGILINRNNDRGANTSGNSNIITNGSRIIVPEGMAVITIQDGAITGIITEVGGYEFTTDNQQSKSIFVGDSLVDSLIKSSWEKFKFGGIPATQQLIFYVNLREIPNNRFGTQSEIYWDDAYLGAQVGALTRGTYTLKIIDPITFVRNYVPAQYLLPEAKPFDFQDIDNDASEQLFNEVVGSLSAAFSNYTNDPSRGNRITRIQGDQIGFAQALSAAVEEAYQWKSARGLEIVRTAILAIEYDDDTKELLKDVKKADALAGSRGNSFFQQAVARGMQSAGENGGMAGAGMAFMGMGMNAAGGMMNNMQQGNTGNYQQPNFAANQQMQQQQMQQQQMQQQQIQQQQQQQMMQQEAQKQVENTNIQENNVASEVKAKPESVDPTEKLIQMKKLLDAGIISEEEFKKIRLELIGI